MARLIDGPPPWTSTGLMPTVSMKTISSSRWIIARSSSMTLPPSLMTVVFAAELANPLEGFDQDVGFLNGFFQRIAPKVGGKVGKRRLPGRAFTPGKPRIVTTGSCQCQRARSRTGTAEADGGGCREDVLPVARAFSDNLLRPLRRVRLPNRRVADCQRKAACPLEERAVRGKMGAGRRAKNARCADGAAKPQAARPSTP